MSNRSVKTFLACDVSLSVFNNFWENKQCCLIENQGQIKGGGILLRIGRRNQPICSVLFLKHGILEEIFRYWSKRLPHLTEPKINQFITPTFVPVRLLNPTSFCIKVHCPSGHRMSIAGVDDQTLAAVFVSLGGR